MQSQYSLLISHFFLFKCPLKAEEWLRKEERSAFLATGLEIIWLTDGDAGRDVPSGSGGCSGGFQGFFYHGSRLKGGLWEWEASRWTAVFDGWWWD